VNGATNQPTRTPWSIYGSKSLTASRQSLELRALRTSILAIASELPEQPDDVLLPWLLDNQPQHSATNVLFAKASAGYNCCILAFEIWTSLPPNSFIDITNVLDQKSGSYSGVFEPTANGRFREFCFGTFSRSSFLPSCGFSEERRGGGLLGPPLPSSVCGLMRIGEGRRNANGQL
jgi:hypothetical protein